MAMNSGSVDEEIDGIPTKEPTYGLPAFWIKDSVKENALAKGYTIVDLATVMSTHLTEIVKRQTNNELRSSSGMVFLFP